MLILQSALVIQSPTRGGGAVRTRIRELRRERRLSQADLADAVGTTRQTITSIEVGKYTASLPLAHKIAEIDEEL